MRLPVGIFGLQAGEDVKNPNPHLKTRAKKKGGKHSHMTKAPALFAVVLLECLALAQTSPPKTTYIVAGRLFDATSGKECARTP